MFPLYHRPSSLVFLDDETTYLEMLAMVLPEDWCIRFHTRTRDYLDEINAQSGRWEEDVAHHQEIVNGWFGGKSLPKLVLDYWRSHPYRYRLPSIVVVDYAMPAANGLDVLRASPLWLSYRVLLTGKADEHTAVQAFNDGLIDRFITKQHPDLMQQLIGALRQHYCAPMDFHQGIWRNALRTSQQLALQDRLVQQALRDWLRANNCVEYVVLPDPFGLLSLDTAGQAHWLQLEMYKDLAASVDLARAAGHDETTISAIAGGIKLSNAEWLQALRANEVPQCADAFALGTGGYLIAAHFPQNALGSVGLGYSAFLNSLPQRTIDSEPLPDATRP